MPRIYLGRIDIIFVTDDFEQSDCFELGQEYRIIMREPSSPGIPTGLSLDQEGTHFAWVRDSCRDLMEDAVKEGKPVICMPVEYGKRWRKKDQRLGKYREWREGKAVCWVD